MLATAIALTLTLDFKDPALPDHTTTSVHSAEHGWLSTAHGFTEQPPFGIAIAPSRGQQLHFALREYNANCIHNGQIDLPSDHSLNHWAQTLGAQPSGQQNLNTEFHINADTCAYAKLSPASNQVSVRVTAATDTIWQPQPPQAEPSVFGWAQSNAQGQLLAHYSSNPERAVPAYSLSKTFIAATAALLLAKQNVFAKQNKQGLQQPLNSWGPVCDQASWQQVTLAQALDMRTGHYHSPEHGVDEAALAMINDFFDVAEHDHKLKHACSYPSQQAQPDQQPPVVYQTSATYLLATALQNALNQQQRGRLDQYLYQHVWQPLQLSPLAYSIDASKDERQQVWGGYGLTLLPSDLVKLAHFVQQDPLELGFADILAAPEQAYPVAGDPSLRYRHSIWFWQHPESEKWYPFLSGYGGIMVIFLDQQHLYYLVSDQHDHRFRTIIDAFEERWGAVHGLHPTSNWHHSQPKTGASRAPTKSGKLEPK